LRAIIRQLQHRRRVHREWGFAGCTNRGLGIAALFTGESGTGKTMAAEAIANATGLDLYRIDLASTVSKYIGETEKNLKKIFDGAEGSGAVLLFDEADALFGKRSEVKDSHDRYANIETAYLLQRIETYRGLAILTTNMKGALDRAFLRRIRFVVQFPFPDEAARRALWLRQFPPQAPLADDIGWDALARMQLSGGHIRSVALNAAFMAAHEDRAIAHAHLIAAAQAELAKLERGLRTQGAQP
jgi:SpoVK/Ycf46/Vps4 family AAA+-type ATPase